MKKIFLILFVLASINSYARVGEGEYVRGTEGKDFQFTEVEVGSEYIGCQFTGRVALAGVLKCMNGLHAFGYIPHGDMSILEAGGTFYFHQIMKKK